MVWLTGLLIALMVLSADFAEKTAVANADQHFLVGLICLLFAPGFAVIQSRISVRRWTQLTPAEASSSLLHSTLMLSNLVVWLFGCLALLIIARWPQIVRANWNLDRVPLLDELVLVTPMVISILISWLLIFDAERVIEGGEKEADQSERFHLTWQRFKTFFGLVLVPIAFLFLARDLLALFNPEGLSPVLTGAFFFGFLLLFLVLYPILVSLTWQTRKLPNALALQLREEASQHGMKERVAVWDTQKSMANAIVVGMVPKLRRIFLTDQLLEKLEDDEIRAVFRHELGHLAHRHLQMRLALMLAPLVGLMVMAMADFNSTGSWLDSNPEQVWVKWAFAGLGLFFYAGLVLTRFVRRSEIEADLFAIQKPDGTPSLQLADAYCRALFKMAAMSPALFRRSTLAHPSIELRIEVIRQVIESPEACRRFHRRFSMEQHLVAAGLLIVMAIAAAV